MKKNIIWFTLISLIMHFAAIEAMKFKGISLILRQSILKEKFIKRLLTNKVFKKSTCVFKSKKQEKQDIHIISHNFCPSMSFVSEYSDKEEDGYGNLNLYNNADLSSNVPDKTWRLKQVTSFNFSSNGRYFCFTGKPFDDTCVVYDFKKRKEVVIRNPRGRCDALYKILFSPNNRYIILNTKINNVYRDNEHSSLAYDLKNERIVNVLDHASPMRSISFSKNSRYLFNHSQDGSCKIYDFKKNKIVKIVDNFDDKKRSSFCFTLTKSNT